MMPCLLLGILLVSQVSCSRTTSPDGSTFQHDQAATLFLEAMKVRSTDPEQAMTLLTQSLDSRPSYNAYYHRAWLLALKGEDDKARQDIEAGLKLEPENAELKWLAGELSKPTAQRKLDMPPAVVK
jgi:Tfp pilus assembly protein PilF